MRKFKTITTAMVLALGGNFAAADDVKTIVAQEWRTIVEPVLTMGENTAAKLIHAEDAQLRQEMYRALYAQLAAGYFAMAYADKDYPDFWPYFNQAFASLAPNPDTDYYVTPIDGSGIYKLSGDRGTVKRILFQTGNGSFVPRGVLDKDIMGRTTGNYDVDDLPRAKDGAFEVVLSTEKPAGYKGPWWKLNPESTYLFVRQVSYDWLREIDGRLAIERLDRPAAKPRPSAEQLAANLEHIATWAEGTTNASAMFVAGIRKDLGTNHVGYRDLTQYGAMLTQRYAYGIFDLAPDEALVVSANVPKQCRYWSMHLIDDFGFTIDWMHRQTSINGFTAKVDKDGIFRVVISARDPGVPNWLDTTGYQTGGVQIRWEQCDSYPTEHQSQVIKVDEVRKQLPADTPVVTAEARDASIRQRRKGAQMRKRW